ncbi:MAG: polymer-forming cytoskeletal protein [Gammaproteobacteria bacterium]|jgi:cytoskeletal protein CcmA (bactofilin family)|nr:polymer-forming cytoskeletal protein [Gammaproteobacteria bacterium]MDX2459793.1 polymer-forming cytoskeletal protein [Gammaproteobacteria bacterium]
MFGNRKKIRTTKIDTLIGSKSEILGDVRFSGGLHVDGTVKGNVVADEDDSSVLTLSEGGTIEGEVRVPNVVLNGTVIGDVHARQHIELASNARITGNVYYSLIEMAMGAELNGNLVHVAEESEVPLQIGHGARFGMVEES